MENLNHFGHKHLYTYINDYAVGKISFTSACLYIGCCFGDTDKSTGNEWIEGGKQILVIDRYHRALHFAFDDWFIYFSNGNWINTELCPKWNDDYSNFDEVFEYYNKF